jgi:hypothetical protein
LPRAGKSARARLPDPSEAEAIKALVVKAFHLEPGVRHSRALDEAFDRARDRLRRTAGLDRAVR